VHFKYCRFEIITARNKYLPRYIYIAQHNKFNLKAVSARITVTKKCMQTSTQQTSVARVTALPYCRKCVILEGTSRKLWVTERDKSTYKNHGSVTKQK